MGLDMYAYTAPIEMVGEKEVDLNDYLFFEGSPREGVNINFAYWRKLNHLHGWMEELYYDKQGSSDSFNCATVRLIEEDFNNLEASLNKNTLVHRAGPFFGNEELKRTDVTSIRNFIKKGRKALTKGLAVIYDSWW